MPNDRLRDALLRNGLTPAAVAEKLGVDPKSVERWMTQDRTPYPRHRHAIAALARESESYLWPNAVSSEKATRIAQSEVVQVYPRRAAVPSDLWGRLLRNAGSQIGILVYAGLFLVEQEPRLIPLLKAKAAEGVKVRVLLGDPDAEAIALKSVEEGTAGVMKAKIEQVMQYYRHLRDVDNAQVHLHHTTLYNSIYRFDDEMLVNTHVYGFPAPHAPVMHIRKLSGGDLFDTYADSFDRVVAAARPAWPAEVAA
ncbi:XRE family transcriptional regulator [Plantactinospora sp. ZYX-F-223]|uniref:XRE family transcriptional regulator n=1 Tax=Plantactinospora sp. ZYX-F-223 TaxID=3144103 RepID=UPI0031FBCE03